MTSVISVSGIGGVWSLSTVTVLMMAWLGGAVALTFTTSTKVALAPGASVTAVAVKKPVPPTGGVMSVKVGPVVCMADTTVVLAGMGSLSTTFVRGVGPVLLTVIV